MEIPKDQIEQAPSFGSKVRAEFIEGMGKINEKFVIILNINQVLEVEEMFSLSEKVTEEN